MLNQLQCGDIMNDLLDLISQTRILTPLIDNDENKVTTICPHCFNDDVKRLSNQSTLVSSGNHYWKKCKCNHCLTEFTHQHKLFGKDRINHWYTEPNDVRVRRGVSNCFESQIYNCKHCGSDVKKEYREMDGVSPLEPKFLSWSNSVKHQREFWRCHGCNKEVEVD